jgi:O-antigen ligase
MEAMVPLVSGIAFLFAASVFFRDSRSRVVFAIVVVGNAMTLTCWGFIQRSGDNAFLLPGVLHSSDTIPFASFIYKNAGAAWMIPAIAIVATAMLKGKTFRWHNDSANHRTARAGYGSASGFFEVSNLVLISAAMFLAAGLVISLCRGAWLAVGIALVTGFLVDRRLQITRNSVIGLVVGAVAVMGLLIMLGGEDVARSRAADVTIDRVASDQRWSHWPDGWNAAVANLPLGSGLGTYRYATLPYQESVHKSWFLHAHNQYLEIFTELGIVGITLLLIAIAWAGRHCVRLIRGGEDTSSRRWGMIGLMVLVAGVAQSMIDFVLVIPANAYLYAAVIGIAVGCRPFQKQQHTATRSTGVWEWLPGWKTSVATVTVAIALATMSLQFCIDHAATRQVLAATRTDQLDAPPPAAQIDDAISSALIETPTRRVFLSNWMTRASTF